MPDKLDKKIIAAMQAEFPLVTEPYREMAERIGISQEELLCRLEKYKQIGYIRKMGAVLKQEQTGFPANALCAWLAPKERLEEIGRLMSSSSAVSHCYAREPQPGWPYNLYTMIHAHNREGCRELVDRLADAAGLTDYLLLFSIKEWKKTSMRYFREVREYD